MFSPAAHAIRQTIFSHITRAPLTANSTPIEIHETEVLDPNTLSGLDQAAYFDLKEHEERYDILMSTSFNFSSLDFTKSPPPTCHISDNNTEMVINALPSSQHATQKFLYRLNELKLLHDYVSATLCAHTALVTQRHALITALDIEINQLTENAIKEWTLQSNGKQVGHGLRVVQAQDRRMHTYTSPLALSIMVLAAIIHTTIGVSRESCNFVLASLKAILLLAADMQGTRAQQFTQQHLRDAPDTLATTLYFLNLPPPLQLYITCPRCSCLFREIDHVQMPEVCTSRNVDGVVCGEPLFSNSYRGGRTRRRPIRPYSHQLFETWLAEILLRPGVEDMLESATPSPKELMTDVWHGTYWNDFLGPDKSDFFDAPNNDLHLCMLLYHDFFNPLRNKTAGKLHSIGCFYMICLNLPPELRYDTSFAYLASIVPGPEEPSMEALQSFIRPIANEMLELYNPGVWVAQTHKYPNGRKIRVVVPVNCMDTPAARAFSGFCSHGHTNFCYLCTATLDRIGSNTLDDFTLRTGYTHRTQATEWENAQSEASRRKLFDKHGVRSCEWLRFASSLPPQLPHIAHVYTTSQPRSAPKRKRKRMWRDSPEHSQEGPSSLTRASLLQVPVPACAVPTSPLPTCGSLVNMPSVTQRIADVRPINDNRDRDENMNENTAPTSVSDDDMDDEDAILTEDDRVVESLYEETLKGNGVDLQKLFDLVNELLKAQVNLSQSVQQIDARTQQLVTTDTSRPSNGGGSYFSPPEPPEPINWDQTIQYNEPAGRQRRARRRILLMALIRETIFRLLSRRSVHDPLPPPPPPGLRAPTLLEFAIRWHEYYKSIFNQLAANIVVQKISIEQSVMLTPEELNELPSMVSSHIKYLCRCYKDQNRDDAEDFNALRLQRCAIGTRKRQLFATRLQVLDRFPEHLGKHRHLIVHLGVDGTSSDEEDPKGSGTYKIRKKPQLSSKVTLLKRDLDHVYQLYFKGPGTKGSQAHRRIPSDISSTRPFTIRGLPLPCISRAWYQELDPAEREFYQFTRHNYDFSFPMSLLNVRESGWPIDERSRNVSP